MRWFYLAVGLLLFAAFCITGRYMRLDFPDKDAISPELRILMRSRHIYMLFNSLIWLALGTHLRRDTQPPVLALQRAGAFLLVISAGCLMYAWYAESYLIGHVSDISRWGVYTSLAGVGFHLIGGLLRARDDEPGSTE